MRHPSTFLLLSLTTLAIACGDSRDDAETEGLTSAGDSTGDAGDDGDGDEGDIKLDVDDGNTGGEADRCKVWDPDGGDGIGTCEEKAPPDAFLPEVQWTFDEDIQLSSYTTPLVANLTDDNGDGEVDLCDIPDVVISAIPKKNAQITDRRLYVIDGATGQLHYKTEMGVGRGTPAIGDMDGDGEPEIVTVRCTGPDQFDNSSCDGEIGIFDGRTGEAKFIGDAAPSQSYGCHIALGDVDNDGDVEILCRSALFDHEGKFINDRYLEGGVTLYAYNAPAMADLDGDSDLEIVVGNAAWHHDGTMYYTAPIFGGFPQIANLDDDPEPEVLVTNLDGINVLEHDGSIKYGSQRPTGVPSEALNWGRPAAIHDFDGDEQAEYALSSQSYYTVYEADASILWSADVLDASGIAAGTAFDFLGDATAEAMYADETRMFVFDEDGSIVLETTRNSGTIVEYPVVADVDDDGSAEIVVVSEGDEDWEQLPKDQRTPVVQVIKEVDDRWIQARRIWNQHTYHVTNVREDGTIPQFEQPSWHGLNTFRTQAQIEGGGICQPEPVPEG